jgi:integrase/recombinase XerD
MNELKEIAKQLARTFRKYHLTYDQTKYVIMEARKLAEISPPRSRTTGTVKRMSRKEISQFLEAAYQQSAYTGLMMQTLYESAARVNEFVNLRPTDLYEEGRLIIQQGKGEKRREILIPDHLVRSLLIHLNGRKQGYLFETNRHSRYSTRRIQQIVDQVAEAAGIIHLKVKPHMLRHTRATLWIEDGLPKDFVQYQLGHSKPETTQQYTETANVDASKYREIINQ